MDADILATDGSKEEKQKVKRPNNHITAKNMYM